MTTSTPGAALSVLPPLPEIGPVNEGFWSAARNHELRLQKCGNCGHIRYPISEICPVCLSDDFSWALMSGHGTVYCSIVFHQVYHPFFADKVPYNVVLVELDEGPILVSNVVNRAPRDVAVGDRVRVLFDRVTDDVIIPRFEPWADNPGGSA
jgi:uncharacterized protein